MTRPPRRPIRRVLAVVGLGCVLAWWGWRASSTGPPPPPVLPIPEEIVFDAPAARGGDQHLDVQVLDERGAPVADVLLAAVSGARIASARTDGSGRARLLELVDGPHRIAAVALDRPPVEAGAVVPHEDALVIALDAPYANLPALEPAPTRDLVGRVHLPFAADAAGYEVLLLPPWPGAGLPPLDGTVERRATATEDGTFALPALAVGTYDVVLLPPWASGDRWPALARQQHSHRAGEGPAELALSGRHGEVWGILADADGLTVGGALVELVDSSAPTRVFPHQISAPDGRFHFPAVPAGAWRLRVTAGEASVERLVRVSALLSERIDLPPLATSRP